MAQRVIDRTVRESAFAEPFPGCLRLFAGPFDFLPLPSLGCLVQVDGLWRDQAKPVAGEEREQMIRE
jgi:hypothetical protein